MEGKPTRDYPELRGEFLQTDDPRWTSFLAVMKHDVYHLPEYLSLAVRWKETAVSLSRSF